jgi:hypothetical protein
METFDLASLDTSAGAEAGFELQLLHPATRAPLPLYIRLLGMDGETYRRRQSDLERRRVEGMQRRAQQRIGMAEIENDTIELLAAVTAGWRGDFVLDGTPLPYTEHNAQQLYRRFAWIREQVDQAVGNRANFLPRSPAS